MNTVKRLGIWMNHSIANLIDLSNEPMTTTVIESAFTQEEKSGTLEKGEKAMHHKEQHLQKAFYEAIGDAIKNYTDVLLFGPTAAKETLFNILKADKDYHKIKITIKQTDKLTENQQYAFVRDFFFKQIA